MRAFFAIACAGMLLGCAADDPPSTTVEETDASGRDSFVPLQAELPLGVPEGSVALEVLSWATLDDEDTLGDRLAALALPVPSAMTGPEASWRAQGLRLVRLSTPDVGAFMELAPPLGTVRRRVVLPGAAIEEIARARRVEGRIVVDTPEGPRTIESGAPILRARAWGALARDGGAEVRADLEAVMGRLSRSSLIDRLDPDALSAVRTIPGLASHVVLRPGEAWAIVAETPDARWRPVNAPNEPAPALRPVDPAFENDRPASIGPSIRVRRTSGESLFEHPSRALVLGEHEGVRRLVIVLVARGPDRYEIALQ